MPAKTKANLMKRTARVYLNSLNDGKVRRVRQFLHRCHDVTQYFIDLFWQRQDYSGKLADLPTVHKGHQFSPQEGGSLFEDICWRPE